MLTLLLLRHAKAEPYAGTDHARELSPRGRLQACAVGEDLRGRGLLPDLMLCSSAERTRQTLQHVQDGLGGHKGQVHVIDELYQASPALVHDLVSEHAPASGTVLVVGHEPIMSMTAAQYAGPESDPTALLGVSTGMSTASFAVIDLDGPTEPTGTLRELVRASV